MRHSAFGVVAICLSLAIAPGCRSAQVRSPVGAGTPRVAGNLPDEGSARTGADPTDFIACIEPSYEHVSLDNGSDVDLYVLRTDFALGVEYGKMLSKTTAFFVKPQVGIGDGGRDWGVKFGFRVMFPKAVLLR